ncbi:MAG: ABC transporter ATP-binding protein [Verrucomicrobia bacterium]|nr:MAG: ABC transporter ATP-binding protein [Verrucomicrobiota bacterium]
MSRTLPKQLLPFIWHFLKGYKFFVVTFAFLALLTGSWAPLNSILIKYMIDVLGKVQQSHMSAQIIWLAVFFLLNFGIHNLCWRSLEYLNYRFQPVIKNQIISETFDYVHGQTQQFFQDNLAGRIASQINTIADNLERIIHELSQHILRTLSQLVVAFISMYSVHPSFFYILLTWFLVFTVLSLRLSKRFIHLSEHHAASEAIVSGQLVDSITNANNVRIFSRKAYEKSYLEKALLVTEKTFREKEIYILKLSFLQGSSLAIMIGMMLFFLIDLRIKQKVSIGDFALILGLAVQVGYMIWWGMEQVQAVNKAIGKCKQSLMRLLTPWEIKDREDARPLQVEKGEITFSGVRFGYRDSQLFFQNKSVTIAGDQKVGLVGYSGSGKSTFINLILRLYEPTSGSIFIDGQNIRECTQESLRGAIAMIPQDPSLFHRSLMENIRYGRISATDEEVIDAAKRAHAHEFIAQLPEGYNALVGERGVKLSGGQRQRIAIARAILKAAPILILDEATSQLDSVTESLIQESLWPLMRGKTAIVIAHRLSTLLHMDRILVFDQGKIVEDGSHEVLLAQKGLYRTLWDAQIGGFLPDRRVEDCSVKRKKIEPGT